MLRSDKIVEIVLRLISLCTASVFIVLLTGQYKGYITDGIPLIQQSVSSQFGSLAIHIITISVCLFAFTSILGNCFYAESNILFITKNKVVMIIFRILAAIMVFIGENNNITVAWSLADITMGVEAIINIIAIVLLSNIAINALKDYEKKK